MTKHFVGYESQYEEGTRILHEIGEKEICVMKVDGQLYAYENTCVHQGGPVCEGLIMEKVEEVLADDKTSLGEVFSEKEKHIICPWHGWEFKLETGECVVNKKLVLNKYEITLEGDKIYVSK